MEILIKLNGARIELTAAQTGQVERFVQSLLFGKEPKVAGPKRSPEEKSKIAEELRVRFMNPWKKEEIERLRAMLKSTDNFRLSAAVVRDLARDMGRSESAINNRCWQLKQEWLKS